MKCYFALTEPDSTNQVYIDLLEVTLKSAVKNTSLDLYALYDGKVGSPCYSLLKSYNVSVIPHKFSHEQFLPSVYPESYMKRQYGKAISYKKIAGTFMRLDIPFIEKDDAFVLYCDIDVLFNSDIRLEELPKPQYLAAAPEFEKDITKMSSFNAGILLLNVPNMKEKISEIFTCLKKGERNSSGLFDQGYLNQFCFKDMDLLPIEFNWKPYWGINPQAKIIHFHGMKPNGNIDNSGFTMKPSVHYRILKGHPLDFEGLVYYNMLFFETLGKDGKQWISSYLTNVFITNLSHANNKSSLSKIKNKFFSYFKYFGDIRSSFIKKIKELGGGKIFILDQHI